MTMIPLTNASMTKKKKSTRSTFFARIGAKGWRDSGYDTFTYDSPALRRWMAAQLSAKGSEILSLGCGAGELEKELAAQGHAVTGLDLSPAMLQRARRKGLNQLVAADASRLPFGAGRFDAVTIFESIGYLALEQVFAETRRVLRMRGRLLITTYGAGVDAHGSYRKWRADEVGPRLSAAGFKIERRRYLEVRKSGVRDAASEDRAGLVYVLARPTR